MTLDEGLRAILGKPGFLLARPGGTVLALTPRNGIVKLGRGGPHQWMIALNDAIALDWTPLSPETQAKMRQGLEVASGVGG